MRDIAPSDSTNTRDAEDLANLCFTGDDLFVLRLEQTDERVVDIFQDVVDDLVEPELHVFALRDLTRLAVRPHVEPDDGRVRHDREVDVGLGDAADAAKHERQANFVVILVELAQGVGDRFERALGVGLDDQVQRRDFAALHHREDIFESGAARENHWVPQRGGLAAYRARFGDGARHLVARSNAQLVTGERNVVEPEYFDRNRRPGFDDLLTALVEHRAHAAPSGPGNDGIADVECAVLHERGHYRPAPGIEVGFEHCRDGRSLRVGDEVFGDLRVGDEQHRVEEVVDSDRGRGRHVDDDRVAAPLFGNELLLGELLTNSRRIGVLTIDLGDRHHDRNLSDARVTDRLDGLRHHTVIGRNNEDRDVGDVRAA